MFKNRKSVCGVALALGILVGGAGSLRAETVWNAGDQTGVANLLDAANWSNGAPTLENPGTITGAVITTSGGFFPANTANSAIVLNLSTGTNLTVGGLFVPFQITQAQPNAAPTYFSLLMDGDARMTVNGNAWGGTNNTATTNPIAGKDFGLEMTFAGNSYFKATGELWAAMSAKSKITIQDNASVEGSGGNSGIGWSSCSVNGSTLDMTGGSLTANNFYVTQSAPNAVMTQTGGTFTVKGFFGINQAGGVYNLSGGQAILPTARIGKGTWNISGTKAADGTPVAKVTTLSLGVLGDDTAATGGKLAISGNFVEIGTANVGAKSGGNGTLELSGTGEATVTYLNLASKGGTGRIVMSGDSKLTAANAFVPFRDANGTSAMGILDLSGNAELTVVNGSGAYQNFWGGTNSESNVTNPLDSAQEIDGQKYVGYFTFAGDSKFTANEMWLGMSTKNYIKISDNAVVTSKGGNSGLGWGANSAGSRLVMTGGTFTAPAFQLSNKGLSYMDISGGTANLTTLEIANNELGEGILSMTGGTLNSTTVKVGANGTGSVVMNGAAAKIETQTLYVGCSSKDNSFELKNGTLNVTGNADMNCFVVGNGGSGKSTFTQTGGTANVKRSIIGVTSNGTTEFNVLGGTMNVTGTFYVEDKDGHTTDVNIGGTGVFNASGQEVHVAQHGNANLAMTDTGSLKAGSLMLGYNHDGSAANSANMTMSGNASVEVANLYLNYNRGGNDGNSAVLTMSGDSKIKVTSNFIPFRGFHDMNKSAKAYVEMTLKDNANIYVTGNFWGGSNTSDFGASPLDGKEYAANYTFSGNSVFSVSEFWVAMSAKTHVLIEDNASVVSRGGNSGMGWDRGGRSAGSLLEMTGGSLVVPTFYLGNNQQSSMIQTGGVAKFGTLYVKQAGSVAQIGGTGDFQVGTLNLQTNGAVKVERGGDFYGTSLNADAGTSFTVASGGNLQVGAIGDTTGKTLTIAGAGDYTLGGNIVLDVYSKADFDKIVVDSTSVDVLNGAAILLNLLNDEEFSTNEAYTLANWGSGTGLGSLDLSKLSVDVVNPGYIARFMPDGTILFGDQNAIPEPGSLLLMVLGALGLGFCANRRYRLI